MFIWRFLLAAASLERLVAAKNVQFNPEGVGKGTKYQVNIPSSTASSNEGPIYFQIKTSSDVEWIALGQGGQMSGANIFVLYSASSTSSNVTLSARIGQGHFEPEFNSRAKVSLLPGSGIEKGKMIANVRCDNCLTWDGGRMNPRDPASEWIWAIKTGSPMNSMDVSESISQHEFTGAVTLDLTKATGDDSENPFSDEEEGGDPTIGVVVKESTIITRRSIHGLIMSIVFVILLPSFALTLHLVPYGKTASRIHAPLQLVSLCLAVAGFGLGITVAKDTATTNSYHVIIGIVVISCLVLFQPIMGYFQHLHHKKTGGKGFQGVIHRWLGRGAIVLAIINGGFGLKLSGIGNPGVPRAAAIAYVILAVFMGIVYIGVVVFKSVRQRKIHADEHESTGSDIKEKDERIN